MHSCASSPWKVYCTSRPAPAIFDPLRTAIEAGLSVKDYQQDFTRLQQDRRGKVVLE